MSSFNLKVKWDETFIALNELEGYPIGGFVGIFGDNGGDSDVYVMDTILSENIYSITFKYPGTALVAFDTLSLYYIDYIKDPQFNPFKLFAAEGDLTQNIIDLRNEHKAAVLTWDGIDPLDDSAIDFNLFMVNDVVKLPMSIDIKCSFAPLYQKSSVDFNHYSGYQLGQLPYNKVKTEDQILSLNGSIDKIKRKMTDISKEGLGGILHFDTSGVMSL